MVDGLAATKILELVISSTEQASAIVIDTSKSTIIVVGTLGTYMILTYTSSTLTLVRSALPYTAASPLKTYIDVDVGFLHVFYTDSAYVKYDYIADSVKRIQNLGQNAVNFYV